MSRGWWGIKALASVSSPMRMEKEGRGPVDREEEGSGTDRGGRRLPDSAAQCS